MFALLSCVFGAWKSRSADGCDRNHHVIHEPIISLNKDTHTHHTHTPIITSALPNWTLTPNHEHRTTRLLEEKKKKKRISNLIFARLTAVDTPSSIVRLFVSFKLQQTDSNAVPPGFVQLPPQSNVGVNYPPSTVALLQHSSFNSTFSIIERISFCQYFEEGLYPLYAHIALNIWNRLNTYIFLDAQFLKISDTRGYPYLRLSFFINNSNFIPRL